MNIPKEVEEAIKKRAEETHPYPIGPSQNEMMNVDLKRYNYIAMAREFYLLGMQDKENCEKFFDAGQALSLAYALKTDKIKFPDFYAQRFNKQ